MLCRNCTSRLLSFGHSLATGYHRRSATYPKFSMWLRFHGYSITYFDLFHAIFHKFKGRATHHTVYIILYTYLVIWKLRIAVATIEPTTGNISWGNREKHAFPGLSGRWQGKVKSVFFPCHPPRNFFPRFLLVFSLGHQCPVGLQVFSPVLWQVFFIVKIPGETDEYLHYI